MIAEDNAMPSGNGLACLAMQKLSLITNDLSYLDSAKKALVNWDKTVKGNGQAFPSLMRAYEFYLGSKSIIYIRAKDEEMKKWKNQINKKINDQIIILYLDDSQKKNSLVEGRPYKKGGVAYLCQDNTCLPPIFSAKELIKVI